MSKIYSQYLRLKEENQDKMYLFHSGMFYIFIADDAKKINEYVVLKETKFTNDVMKCGFPSSRLDDYLRVFQNHKLIVEVIDKLEDTLSDNISLEKNKKYDKIFNMLYGKNINNITPIKALEILDQIMRCIHE